MNNIPRVATFEKVSYEEYSKSIIEYAKVMEESVAGLLANDSEGKLSDAIATTIQKQYDDLMLPRRATQGSAGYDFFAPIDIEIPDDETSIIIPTGIRCKIDPGYFLSIYPRSGLGFKYQVGLDNTVGIIDQDYYYSDNEGHIMIKLHAKQKVSIPKGKAFAQGIFTQFFIVTDDESTNVRNGGFGSTTEQQVSVPLDN